MKKGKLIIIEAGDGSGKETQTKILFERLKREGYRAIKVSFPDYDSESSSLVKMYLSGKFGDSAQAVNAYAASTFFAVDRFASFRLKWQSDYESGAIIMADRYTTSNMVHQAVKLEDKDEREKYLAWLYDFEFVKLGLPVPDKVIFLDMEPSAAQKLIELRAKTSGAQKDIHERDEKYLVRCHDAYYELASKYGWERIRCSENGEPFSREEIAAKIYEAVAKILKEEHT